MISLTFSYKLMIIFRQNWNCSRMSDYYECKQYTETKHTRAAENIYFYF